MSVRVAVEIRSGGRNQDRAQYFSRAEVVCLALADGAGGFGDGGRAADRVIAEAEAFSVGAHTSATSALESADVALARDGSLSTGVIVEIQRGLVSGASAGDSIAWLVNEGEIWELTSAQFRKPLLGGGACPVSFSAPGLRGRLLVASDGLINYVSREQIILAASGAELGASARALAELPRLASGTFPDDVSILLAESDA